MIKTFASNPDDGPISVSGHHLSDIFDHVMDNGAAVIQSCFSASEVERARDAIHAWGQRTELQPPQTYIDDNFHAVESGISPRQKTPHVYHSYNLYRAPTLHPDLASILMPMFERLRVFQNALTGNSATFDADAHGRKARPQIIHYPSGGGMFGRHIHPLEPQRVGLILGLSKRGRDFERGSTHFEIGGARYGTDEIHDAGDLILFRFDIPHWITAIDEGDKFDPESKRGRWTAVLPYY